MSQYHEEIATLQVQLAGAKANSHDTRHLDLQNTSLEKENSSLLEENYRILAKVIKEKQQLQKEVLALDAKQVHSSCCTFVSKLEDCKKEEITPGVNNSI
jgi:hypothetical protein